MCMRVCGFMRVHTHDEKREGLKFLWFWEFRFSVERTATWWSISREYTESHGYVTLRIVDFIYQQVTGKVIIKAIF